MQYINKDWEILYKGGTPSKDYWVWTNMLKPELFDVLLKLLDSKCKRGEWKLYNKIFREPKRSIIIEDHSSGRLVSDEWTDKSLNVKPHDSYDWSSVPIIKDIGLRIYKELKTDELFDYCLVNIYDSGSDGINWHTDGEAGKTGIMSVSLGCTRDFGFRPIDKKNNGGRAKKRVLDNGRTIFETEWMTRMSLESGDVVYMKYGCQKVLKHTLCRTKSKKVNTIRINLTYRKHHD